MRRLTSVAVSCALYRVTERLTQHSVDVATAMAAYHRHPCVQAHWHARCVTLVLRNESPYGDNGETSKRVSACIVMVTVARARTGHRASIRLDADVLRLCNCCTGIGTERSQHQQLVDKCTSIGQNFIALHCTLEERAVAHDAATVIAIYCPPLAPRPARSTSSTSSSCDARTVASETICFLTRTLSHTPTCSGNIGWPDVTSSPTAAPVRARSSCSFSSVSCSRRRIGAGSDSTSPTPRRF